jgi:hypothetical protein
VKHRIFYRRCRAVLWPGEALTDSAVPGKTLGGQVPTPIIGRQSRRDAREPPVVGQLWTQEPRSSTKRVSRPAMPASKSRQAPARREETEDDYSGCVSLSGGSAAITRSA